MGNSILVLSLLAFTCSIAFAFEPGPLQDFCVADSAASSGIQVIHMRSHLCSVYDAAFTHL